MKYAVVSQYRWEDDYGDIFIVKLCATRQEALDYAKLCDEAKWSNTRKKLDALDPWVKDTQIRDRHWIRYEVAELP